MITPQQAAQVLLARRRARRSLRAFVRQAWTVLEPVTPLVWGWHMDAICDHLQAVSEHRIANLLIEVPPGSSKSTIASVCWPIWHWLSHPEARFLTASYSLGLATRDAVRSRRVLDSPWYRALCRDRDGQPVFRLTSDQNTKTRYENDRTGYRFALVVGSTSRATGERGTFTLIDDPHSVTEPESGTTRQATLAWHDEAFFNRINDPAQGGRVVIGQRVHSQDLIGHLREQPGWTELRLPEEFEADEPCQTPLPWQDPRQLEGELLRPERVGPEQVEQLQRQLGAFAWAAQYQQRPAPREGGLFKAEHLAARALPAGMSARRVRYWDKGYSVHGDYTVGVLMARDHLHRYIIEDVVRGRWAPDQRNDLIRDTARADRQRHGRPVKVFIEQPPGAGSETTLALLRHLAGLPCAAVKPRGSKEERAETLVSQCAAGNVLLVSAPWNADFISELCLFPFGAHDDQVDAAVGAFTELAQPTAGSPAAGGQRPVVGSGLPNGLPHPLNLPGGQRP
jgi:predicted phage terminase large subunit-like protein